MMEMSTVLIVVMGLMTVVMMGGMMVGAVRAIGRRRRDQSDE